MEPGGKSATMTAPEETKRVRIRNILVGTDFSPASDAALDYALAIARRYEACLHILHVIRPESYLTSPVEALPSAIELIRQSAEQEMANLLISGRLRGLPHQVAIEEGDLWTTFSRLVEKNEIDLIVVGTRGCTGAKKMLLGSVSEQIFRLAEQPVLTVGPRARSSAKDATLHRILFPTDFDRNAQAALRYALSLAQEHQSRLTLLHVVEETAWASEQARETIQEFFKQRLEKLVPSGVELWCEPEFVVRFGDPIEKVLETAACDPTSLRDEPSDLIVLGVRGARPIAARLPGTKVYRIVCEAACPVLTVRGGIV
jgi:nucleotide-binding universal stress UspA family protein